MRRMYGDWEAGEGEIQDTCVAAWVWGTVRRWWTKPERKMKETM